MENKPLIKKGWLRALLFVLIFAFIATLSNIAAGMLVTVPGAGKTPAGDGSEETFRNRALVVSVLATFLAAVFTVYVFRRWVDKQSFESLGLQFKGYEKHAGAGFFMGLLLLGTGTLLLIANKNLQWTNIGFDARQLFLGFGLMAITAFAEELVFRGYLLNNLLQSMSGWKALALSALVFALFHGSNPGISYLALFNIFLAGLMLGINYIYTGNLWFGMLFHFSWNFYQGSVLGYPVSGLNLSGVLQQELTGNPLFTGGKFGFEGSLFSCVLSVLTIAALAWVYENRRTEAKLDG